MWSTSSSQKNKPSSATSSTRYTCAFVVSVSVLLVFGAIGFMHWKEDHRLYLRTVLLAKTNNPHQYHCAEKLLVVERTIPTFADQNCTLENVGGEDNKGYGAWPVCTNFLPKNPVVFSFGIGGDISFDKSMAKKFNASVYCYDPTIQRARFNGLNGKWEKKDHLHFRQFGFGKDYDVIPFYRSTNKKIQSMVSTAGLKNYEKDPALMAPVLKLDAFLKMENVEWVDLLKIDVEGVELGAFSDEDFPIKDLQTSQILIEFHARLFPKGAEQQAQAYKNFEKAGFRLAYEAKSKEEVIFVRDRIVK